MAVNFWLADEYNVFVIGNHTQGSGCSATGRVWVGQTALYNGYNVGADLAVSRFAYLSVLGDMNITGGINYTGSSEIDALGTVTKYTMTNNNGVPGQPLTLTYRPWDIYPYSFLETTSVGWASMAVNGTMAVAGTALTLTGTNAALNTFLINAANVANSGMNISTITTVNLVIPAGSTAIINIDGNAITLNAFTMLYNGVAITKAQAAYVLWNFPSALTLNLNSSIYGAFLAPYATIATGDVKIYGIMMCKNLSGGLNAVNNPFAGTLPDLYNPSTTGSSTSFTTTASTSTTTSTTTTTTTTSTSTSTSTSSTATTTCAPRCQAISDIMESVALEQTALSHILNAEGEKIQKALSMNLSTQCLLDVNKSVSNTVDAVSMLEMILHGKLALFDICLHCDITTKSCKP
ncbi:MAG: choice-of-anchor A family protein [Ruthenibacterium sp.]